MLCDGEAEEGGDTAKGGMGLGDGEGEKDVSEQIESQDQLEDAKRPEDYENQPEDKDCKVLLDWIQNPFNTMKNYWGHPFVD